MAAMTARVMWWLIAVGLALALVLVNPLLVLQFGTLAALMVYTKNDVDRVVSSWVRVFGMLLLWGTVAVLLLGPIVLAVYAKNEYGQTPLHWAAWRGNEKTVQALLDAKADPNIKDDGGNTPLHWAAWRGRGGVVAALLDAGADANAKDDGGDTPLHWAARGGDKKTVQALLDKGADVHARDEDGRTPLHWAVENGHAEVVTMLLKAGADPNAGDSYGRTPLHMAADRGREKIVEVLEAQALRAEEDHSVSAP